METSITWVGIDAHKKTLAIAVLAPGAKPEQFTVDNTGSAIRKREKEDQRGCAAEERLEAYAETDRFWRDVRQVHVPADEDGRGGFPAGMC
jgi:hypothetical protein